MDRDFASGPDGSRSKPKWKHIHEMAQGGERGSTWVVVGISLSFTIVVLALVLLA